jgi:spermidine synthase
VSTKKPLEFISREGWHTLHDAPGQRRWITVTEDTRVRSLALDGCEQGAMYLDSDAPVFHYLWFHKCSLLARPPVRRALVLGAGAFTAAKCLALDHPDAAVDTVDDEPELEAIGRQYFGLATPKFADVRFHGQPAEEFLTGSRDPYDFILDDLFDGFQHVPLAGRGVEHVRRLRGVLNDGGVCIKNVIWSPLRADARAACDETWDAWQQTFATALTVTLGNPSRGHNRILIGWADRTAVNWPPVQVRLAETGVPLDILAHAGVHSS